MQTLIAGAGRSCRVVEAPIGFSPVMRVTVNNLEELSVRSTAAERPTTSCITSSIKESTSDAT
jgi:hypothetical protein